MSNYLQMWSHIKTLTKAQTARYITTLVPPKGHAVPFFDLIVLDVDLVEALRNWMDDALDEEDQAKDIFDQTKNVPVILGFDYDSIIGSADLLTDGTVIIKLLDPRIMDDVKIRHRTRALSINPNPASSAPLNVER